VRKGAKLALIVSFIIIIVTVALFAANKKPEDEWIGISLHSVSENEAQVVKESGASGIRIDCYEGFDIICKNAEAKDLEVLSVLDSCTMNNLTVFSLDEWSLNVTHYVSTYAHYVDSWEIWNEPANPAVNWTLLNATLPEDMTEVVQFYISMVQVAAPIIRQYDPTAKIVLFGGLNLWSAGAPNLELDKDFATRLAAMNIEQYGDVLSVHAYPWINVTSSWDFNKFGDALSYYKGLFPSLEMWVTETGHYVDDEDEEGQARYLRGAIQYFYGKVDRLFWYSLVDNPWE
jgi:hypothetical protein